MGFNLIFLATVGFVLYRLLMSLVEFMAYGFRASWIALFSLVCLGLLVGRALGARLAQDDTGAIAHRLRYALEGPGSERWTLRLLAVMAVAMVLELFLANESILFVGSITALALLVAEMAWRVLHAPPGPHNGV